MYNPENNSHSGKMKDVEIHVLVITTILTYIIQNLES